MATNYQMLLDAVENYYGSGSDQWAFIFQNIGNVSEAGQVSKLLRQVPGVDVTLSNSGRILDYNVRDVLKGFSTTENIGSAVNSNNVSSIVGNSVNASIPSVISKSSSTGMFGGVSGIGLTADTGVTATGVLSTIGVALGTVGIGTQLGKVVGTALYESNPDAWDSGVLKGLSQVDWNKFAVSIKDQAQDGILGLFGVNNDTTTMYLDENFLAYMTWYMSDKGYLNATATINLPSKNLNNITVSNFLSLSDLCKYLTSNSIYPSYSQLYKSFKNAGMPENGLIKFNGQFPTIKAISENRDVYFVHTIDFFEPIPEIGSTLSTQRYSKTTQYVFDLKWNKTASSYELRNTKEYAPSGSFKAWGSIITDNDYNIDYIIFNTNANVNLPIDGISNNPNSKQFDPTGVGSVATALGALKNQYPELWDKSIKKSVPQEDGTEDEHVYVPIPIPKFNGAFDEQPTTGTPSQSDPSISPDTTPDDELNNASNTIAPPSTPTDDPNTGGGNSPSIIVPSQQASALWAIYNPSLAQLNQLGAWLWSTDFIDQLLKIFNDPMQAIIGLHKVYATPNISGSGNIKVGYLDSGVGSNIVGNQYTYIDCGTVSLREYYGNILDYSPYTTVQLYLPFIGIVPLDVADVTRSSISVKYGVDVLTGACLSSVSVQRDNAGGVLYQYSGNCACQYPLSSGSYMGMLTGAIGAVGSLTKGNIFGTALSIAGMHTSIEHSGGFSGNAGAMGGKKPYLIVSRPQTAMNDGFPAIQGYPSNVFVTLGSCTGYVQVADCHVENISATDKELEKIKQLLKEGVIL